MSLPSGRPPKWAIYIAILLLAWLAVELCLAGRQQSATYDEANHIFAGYRYWMCSDFGSNFETPPLVKLVSAIPLIFQRFRVPVPLCGATHSTISDHNDLVESGAFLYSNDADSILFQTRLFASLFTVALGALLFESAYVMFGVGPALIALTIFAFEPNVLAHGFLVTTDMGLTCCLYAAVYAFYLYLEKGTKRRLVATGIMAGTALTAKHSGLIVFPLLVTLALAELVGGKMATSADKPRTSNRFVNMASALVFVSLIAYVTLWAFYGFRFAAQPMRA
jgi:4-amino-4-deoxy-L-arabinose transferase-like glycosyltransferase